MPYMMGGFPDRETSAAVADAYVEAGADLVELGIPYSDPLADGPVIHAAGTRALVAGATLDSVLTVCERIAPRVPVVPMAYANMALARGPERFARMLADAGAAGAIVPDLPPEEGGPVAEALRGPDSRSFPWSRRRPRPSAGRDSALGRRASCTWSPTRGPPASANGCRPRSVSLWRRPAPNRLYRLRSGSGSGPPSWQRRWAESPTG